MKSYALVARSEPPFSDASRTSAVFAGSSDKIFKERRRSRPLLAVKSFAGLIWNNPPESFTVTLGVSSSAKKVAERHTRVTENINALFIGFTAGQNDIWANLFDDWAKVRAENRKRDAVHSPRIVVSIWVLSTVSSRTHITSLTGSKYAQPILPLNFSKIRKTSGKCEKSTHFWQAMARQI